MTKRPPRRGPRVALQIRSLTIAVLIAAACSAEGASQTPAGPGAASPRPGGSGVVGGGTGEPGSTGSGIQLPPLPFPSLPDQPGSAQLVLPRPGRIDPHPVGAASIEAALDGRHGWVRLTWWSGVEPCNALDSVAVDRSGSTINLTIREGADKLGVACIEIAVQKATIVDLGELGPGKYTITAFGDATPVELTVG